MRPGKATSTLYPASLMLALLIFMSGCSSRSQIDIYVQKIVGTSGLNANKSYLECDIIGSESNACTAIQDMVSVTVAVDEPGLLGPSLDAYITGYTIEYFYYDPADGALKGPVPGLTVFGTNMKLSLGTGTATFSVAGLTFRFKTWSVGVDCHDLAGFTGTENISRLILKITVHGEDSTGKKMSADGSILAYLYDYAPAPLSPAESNDVSKTWCYGMTPEAYWSALCP